MYHIKPKTRNITILATLSTPASHHDPAQKNRANTSSFLRRKQVIERAAPAITKAELDRITSAFPVPAELQEVFAGLSASEFLATAVAYAFISAYHSGDGIGLFSGIERYRRLQERLEIHAIRSSGLFSFWGNLTNDMQVGMPDRSIENTNAIATLFSASSPLAQLILDELVNNSVSAVMIARVWHKALSDKSTSTTVMQYQPPASKSSQVVLQVPSFSANSARHEMVREPGAIHLLNTLELQFDDLHPAAAAMLYNGGDLNSAEPSGAFKLIKEIRDRYPLLGLIGGSTSGFILGASNLEVSAWINCIENSRVLQSFGVKPSLSAFDLLDTEEQTRHTTRRVDGTPMPYGFETLIAGAEILLNFRLRPYATALESGALVKALETFFGIDSTLGGQSARGFGLIDYTLLDDIPNSNDLSAEYHEYVLANREALAQGLVSGTLGTNKGLF